jgi:hypothetical protein
MYARPIGHPTTGIKTATRKMNVKSAMSRRRVNVAHAHAVGSSARDGGLALLADDDWLRYLPSAEIITGMDQWTYVGCSRAWARRATSGPQSELIQKMTANVGHESRTLYHSDTWDARAEFSLPLMIGEMTSGKSERSRSDRRLRSLLVSH